MPMDAIVRVSFQSRSKANRAANAALVGHPQKKVGRGPFRRVGTAVYSCAGGSDTSVGKALAELGGVLNHYSVYLDFLSIAICRTTQHAGSSPRQVYRLDP